MTRTHMFIALLAVTALCTAAAQAELYCNEKVIEKYLYDNSTFSQTQFEWEHANPVELPYGPLTPAQYEQAVQNGEICSVTRPSRSTTLTRMTRSKSSLRRPPAAG